jgi:hypothetical protein
VQHKLIQSLHTSGVLLAALPHQERGAHILPVLVHNSLLYVCQLCDSSCDITLTRENVEVTKDGHCVMLRLRNHQLRLWRVNLKEEEKPVQKSECNHAHDNSSQKELINYLYAACFSPVKSTWIQAIKNSNFTSWPGLTEQAVEKHLSKSTATLKGHLNQQRMNTRSKKIKEEEDCKNETERALDSSLKTHCLYA